MKIKSYLLPVLCVYLFQALFVPLLHFMEESDGNDCGECCTVIQFNTPCADENGPCENPAHHHHNGHSHDDANCFACKTISQVAICGFAKTSFLSNYRFLNSYNELQYIAFRKSVVCTTRAPPILPA